MRRNPFRLNHKTDRLLIVASRLCQKPMLAGPKCMDAKSLSPTHASPGSWHMAEVNPADRWSIPYISIASGWCGSLGSLESRP